MTNPGARLTAGIMGRSSRLPKKQLLLLGTAYSASCATIFQSPFQLFRAIIIPSHRCIKSGYGRVEAMRYPIACNAAPAPSIVVVCDDRRSKAGSSHDANLMLCMSCILTCSGVMFLAVWYTPKNILSHPIRPFTRRLNRAIAGSCEARQTMHLTC